MRLPSSAPDWLILPEVESTQSEAGRRLLAEGLVPGIVFAHHQTAGRGRFGRVWHSAARDSLTMSLVFPDYVGHRQPWLIGMSVALAAAGAVHAQVRWPNDLVIHGRKVGGILTELLPDREERRVPVVGVGINLNQAEFPAELTGTATSLQIELGHAADAETLAREIVDRIIAMPEPESWRAVEPVWRLFDDTPGKRYRLHDGRMGTAIGIGPDGELVCSVEGETVQVLAAEALFG